MPIYKLQKKGKSARRVAVRAESIDIQVPALIICAVLAFVIWLYIVGFDSMSHAPQPTETEAPSTESGEVADRALAAGDLWDVTAG